MISTDYNYMIRRVRNKELTRTRRKEEQRRRKKK